MLETSPTYTSKNHVKELEKDCLPEFIVAIPAYNEERFIGSVVIQALRYTPHVLVIDDGSQDATAYVAQKAGAKILNHPTNRGKSAAINTALGWARQHGIDVLVFIDGDGQHKPDEIIRVLTPIMHGSADIVIGSRFLSLKSKIPHYRKIGQKLLTVATNMASSIAVTDSQSGFRAFSEKAIRLMHFSGTGLSVESEMQFLAKEHALQIVEVPITVIYQEKAKRNPFTHGMQIVSNVAHLVGQHRPLFFFTLLGLIALVVGLIFGLMTYDIYFRTYQLAVGYALIAVLLVIIGVLSCFVGLILHSIKAYFVELQRKVEQGRHLSAEERK